MSQSTAAPSNRRPEYVTLIAVYQIITAAILFLLSCMIPAVVIPSVFAYISVTESVFAALFVAGGALALFLGFGIASLVVAWGLFRLREWARLGAIVLAAFALIGFPIWTIVAVMILVYLTSDEARSAFQTNAPGRAPDELATQADYKTEPAPKPVASYLEDTRPMQAATGSQIVPEGPAETLPDEETRRIDPIPMPPPESEQPTAEIETSEAIPEIDEPEPKPANKWFVPAEEAGMDRRILEPFDQPENPENEEDER